MGMEVVRLIGRGPEASSLESSTSCRGMGGSGILAMRSRAEILRYHAEQSHERSVHKPAAPLRQDHANGPYDKAET